MVLPLLMPLLLLMMMMMMMQEVTWGELELPV